MENIQNPEQHVNEEPRNDFSDVATGFAAMFTFMAVAFIVMCVIKGLM